MHICIVSHTRFYEITFPPDISFAWFPLALPLNHPHTLPNKSSVFTLPNKSSEGLGRGGWPALRGKGGDLGVQISLSNNSVTVRAPLGPLSQRFLLPTNSCGFQGSAERSWLSTSSLGFWPHSYHQIRYHSSAFPNFVDIFCPLSFPPTLFALVGLFLFNPLISF